MMRPGSVTVKFPVFTQRVSGMFDCPACGKKRRVSETLTETQNPFNTNVDGQPKTPQEIHESLVKKADEWQPSSRQRHHTKCWEQVS